MKRITLELGGKSPVLVTKNANIDQAVEGVVNGIFINAGQVCDAGSRLIVADEIHDDFMQKLIEHVRALPMGPGLDEQAFIGPLASDAHKRQVAGFVELTIQDRLDMALDQRTDTSTGYFCSLVIIQDCPLDHPCWTDEIFGPFLVVQRADGIEQMLKIANDIRFGLGAASFCRISRKSCNVYAGFAWARFTSMVTVFLIPPFRLAGRACPDLAKTWALNRLKATWKRLRSCFRARYHQVLAKRRQRRGRWHLRYSRPP